MMGGSPAQVAHAVALAQQGTLGLVCDPLGGLVELPRVFRNATGAAIALAAIEMAVAGVEFAIPADEVIDTMGEIGREMDVRYKRRPVAGSPPRPPADAWRASGSCKSDGADQWKLDHSVGRLAQPDPGA